MKKIGVLLQSMHCKSYFYDLLELLIKSENIELYFIVHGSECSKEHSTGIFERLNKKFFSVVSYVESRVLSKLDKSLINHNKQYPLDRLTPKASLVVGLEGAAESGRLQYSEDSMNSLQKLELDLLFNFNVCNELGDSAAKATKDGVLSFFYGESEISCNSLIGFWDTFYRKDASKFSIRYCDSSDDNCSLVMDGFFPTKRSFLENQASLLSEGSLYVLRLIELYAATGVSCFDKKEVVITGERLVSPSVFQSLTYAFKTTCFFAELLISRKFLKKVSESWVVAYAKGHWESSSLQDGTIIENPKGRFYADPFIHTKNGRSICFVEDYCCIANRARISAVELIDEKNYKELGPIIEEPFHMSFPYVFEYEDELYMIPETNEAKSVRLYKCIDYPMKWEYQKDLFSDFKAVDTMIFEYKEKWWALTNLNPFNKKDLCSTLWLFSSDNPLSDNWVSCSSVPIVFDSRVARNGGLLKKTNGQLVRSRQAQGFNSYGDHLTLAEIKQLGNDIYSEDFLQKIMPDFFDGIDGCHHLHSNENYTVYDFKINNVNL